MKVSTPFNHRIPKDIKENLRWRSKVMTRAMHDIDFADDIKAMCAKDPLFFINGFGWTYDPRIQPFPKLPFILYPFQEEALLELIRSIGSHDILIEKSRDMGASWLLISSYFWPWRFKRDQSFLLVSRVEEYVDSPGNPKALLWKWDYLLDNLPVWLQPRGYNKNQHRRCMHIENPEMNSVTDGESTNKDVARGDRRTGIGCDEFSAVEGEKGFQVLSATRDATNSRTFNFTPRGTNNAAYAVTKLNIKKIRLHWTLHPTKSEGLYTKDENGKYEIIDAKYWSQFDEPIKEMERLDALISDKGVPLPPGKLRSPWYANECDRAANAQEIAQEVDIDYLGSGFQYFNQQLVFEAIRNHCRPALVVGDLEYDDQTAEPIRFREDSEGALRLWFFLDKDNKPPRLNHRTIIGSDISAGTGASNSSSMAWDAVTAEKIAELVSPRIRPEEFAKYSVALAKWLSYAKDDKVFSPTMIWESNGPGRQFGSRVVELGYSNIYLRKNDETITHKVSDIPGWASTKETKAVLMGRYRSALEKGEVINRSKEAVEETLEYIFGNDGSIVHSRSLNKTDPSGAGSNHGDRVIADALAVKLMGEYKTEPVAAKPEVPVGSLAWRNQMREEAEKKKLHNSWCVL